MSLAVFSVVASWCQVVDARGKFSFTPAPFPFSCIADCWTKNADAVVIQACMMELSVTPDLTGSFTLSQVRNLGRSINVNIMERINVHVVLHIFHCLALAVVYSYVLFPPSNKVVLYDRGISIKPKKKKKKKSA